MPTAATSGLRALQGLKYVRAWVSAKTRHLFSNERLGGDLVAVQKEQEIKAAAEQTSRFRHEFSEMFTLLRDTRYARLNRRALYARGIQAKLDAGNEAWLRFVRENRGTSLKQQSTGDPDLLAEQSFGTLMERKTLDARNSDQV